MYSHYYKTGRLIFLSNSFKLHKFLNLKKAFIYSSIYMFCGVIMGELLVSKEGLGYLIMYGSQVFNINLVITSVVMLAIISYFMYFIISILEKNHQEQNKKTTINESVNGLFLIHNSKCLNVLWLL